MNNAALAALMVVVAVAVVYCDNKAPDLVLGLGIWYGAWLGCGKITSYFSSFLGHSQKNTDKGKIDILYIYINI